MNAIDHIWINANPEYRERLRRASEARAAAYYAAWRAVTRGLGAGFRQPTRAECEACLSQPAEPGPELDSETNPAPATRRDAA